MLSMELAQKVMSLKIERKLTWDKVGQIIGISGAFAYRVAHGKSDSKQARKHFNMPKTNVDRMAANLSKADGVICRKWLNENGFDSITQFWRMVAAFLP